MQRVVADLRRSHASLAVADGVSMLVVDKVIGRRQASATEIYAQLGDDPLRAAVERIDATIAEALRIGSGDARGT